MAELNTATKSDGEVLMDEIIYGKKGTKQQANPSDGDDLTQEILYGKRKTKIEGEHPATKSNGDELMDEILYGKKKPKNTSEKETESEDAPKKSKKFDRDDYFGL